MIATQMSTLTATDKLLTEKLVTVVDTIALLTKQLAAKSNNDNIDGSTKNNVHY